jgi:hypothetical protein
MPQETTLPATAFADHPLALPLVPNGIICRWREGRSYTNVPHLVMHHSPSGFAWGYGGSGPADLALNILEWVLRQEGYQGETVRYVAGTCFRLACQLHHDFKWQFLATCDRQEGHIPLETVTTWLATARQGTKPLR